MRKLSLKKAAFFAAAWTMPWEGTYPDHDHNSHQPLIEPFHKTNAYAEPSPKENIFQSIKINKHEVYAMPSTIRDLGNVLPELSLWSGKDIVVVEPSNPSSFESYFGFSGFSRLMQGPDKGKKQLALGLRQLEASYRAMYGSNYSAQLADPEQNRACIITGEMKPGFVHLASQIGHIPQDLKTKEFEQRLADKNSVLLFVLFHEASHCRSYGSKGDIFGSEIDADRAAIQRYKELMAKGWNLDPVLPQKVKSLRLLAPLFNASTEPQNVMSGLMEVHSSAGGFDSSKRQAEDLLREAGLFKIIVKSKVYDGISAEKKKQFHEIADNYVAQFLIGEKKQLEIISRRSGKDAKIAQTILTILPVMQSLITKQIVSNMAQIEDRSLIQKAMLSLLEDNAEISFSPKIKINAAQMARASLKAWDILALKHPDSLKTIIYDDKDALIKDFRTLSGIMEDALEREVPANPNLKNLPVPAA